MKKNKSAIKAPGAEHHGTTGAGGGKGGGGGRAAVEADNTLRSAAVARIVEVLSEGPIEGIAGGAKGIYINDNPFQNPNGTYNYPRAQWDYRIGTPNQSYMPGFAAVQNEVSVNTPFSIVSNNIIRSFASEADEVLITIQLPQGLSKQDQSTGDLNGSSVTFHIDTRVGVGTWTTYGSYTISGKTTSSYEASYRVRRPAGTSGVWGGRTVRDTPDPAANEKNETVWARVTEIQDIKVSYPDAAVAGIAIDAESVGNTIPKRSYLVKGLLVKIPSNYNTVTRAYTGLWNGLLTNSTVAVSNPVWTLYDVLTNSRYGAGIPAAEVDKQTFYDASVYCDQLVEYTDENGVTTQEPRFTFDARIADRPDILKLVKAICGSMNANLIYWNGKYTLIQDRPTSVSKLITKANVIDGYFNYKSSGLYERHTAVNISFNDRHDRYLERVVTVEDPTGIDRYGYNTTDLAAFGATTEGQAIRAGRWLLDTELNQGELVEFKMGLNGFDLTPGDVVSIYDTDYAQTAGAGRVQGYTAGTTSLLLDRACAITPGSSITALLADGRTLETRNIVGTGSMTTLTIASAFTTALFPDADYVVNSAIPARPFKIIDVTVPQPGVVSVKAVTYDANKFSRVETGIDIPAPIFTSVLQRGIQPPTSVAFALEGAVLPTGAATRKLRVTWTPPTQTLPPKGYSLTYSRDNLPREVVTTDTNTAFVPADHDGTYRVSVFSVDFNGSMSGTSADAVFNVTSGEATTDPTGFGAPVGLVAVDSNAYTWVQDDLAFRWEDNPANTRPAASYLVRIMDAADEEVLREVTLPANVRQFVYELAMNVADGGGNARSSVKVTVFAKDAQGSYSSAVTATFKNPPPSLPTAVTTRGSATANFLSWTNPAEADFKGVYVWASTSSGFTPSALNLVSSGNNSSFVHAGLNDSETWYYRIASYDNFNNELNGSDLTLSSEISTTTLAGANVNEFQLSGVTWRPNDPATNRVSWTACTAIQTLGVDAGTTVAVSAGDALWTTGVLYVYYVAGNSTLQTSTSLAAAVGDDRVVVATYRGGTNLEIGNGRAYTDGSFILAGTIGASQLVTGSAVITQGAQIATAIIGNAHITDLNASKITAGTIDANRIAADSITADKLDVSTLSSITATIGTLRTATSGARMEITDNVIRVYDTGGVLRVKLGNLA